MEWLFGSSTNDQFKRSLIEYFRRIQVTDFLIEDPYVDNDYLEDYSSYYASCFNDYHRHCQRVHLFGSSSSFRLTNLIFIHQLTSQDPKIRDKINAVYLGFIVVRPFEMSRIGRTCLVTNPLRESTEYPAIRDYNAHLFGMDLSVKTMAFQEQDQTVTACASTAIWSALHIACKMFHRYTPSPSGVTKDALTYAPDLRKFPSIGLTPEQICMAIRKSGLFPFKTKTTSNSLFKSIIYAYGKAGLPIILGLSLYDTLDGGENSNRANLKGNNYHAVTVNGMALDGPRSPRSSNEIRLHSYRISAIYAHDDQLSPFSEIEIPPESLFFDGVSRDVLKTGWQSSHDGLSKYAILETIIIPIHDKIRVQFPVMYKRIAQLHKKLEEFFAKRYDDQLDEEEEEFNIEWSIYLQENNEFKKELYKDTVPVYAASKPELLQISLPKYIWRVIAYDEYRSKVFEAIYDSTESANGGKKPLMRIYYNETIPYLFSRLDKSEQNGTYYFK